MNILLLTQFFSNTKGGGEYVFSLLAKKLAENGHNVWVITNKISGEEYVVHKNIHLVFVKPDLEYKGGIPPSFLDNFRYVINTIRYGRRITKHEHVDIIHSNNFSPALAGSILSCFSKISHVTTIHDVFSLCGKNYWKKWGKQNSISKMNVFLAPLFEKLMIKLKHDCIHTVSETSKDDLVKFGAKKPIYVIHNSIEHHKIIESKDPIPNQFVYVGRLVFYKNLEIVIKAVNIARKSDPNIKLIIIGGGPHKNILEKLVSDLGLSSNVEFKNYLSTPEKVQIIASSIALVFPSLCEGFGLVILEAFDQSRPVIVSDIRPMSDIVSHETNGFVLDPHDKNKWADCFLKIIKNPQTATEMGINGNHVLRIAYNQESMYKKIIEMYEKCIKLKNQQ